MNPSDLINEADKLVAYFSFPECSVCKSLRPKVEGLVEKFPDFEYAYIDIHKHPALGGQFLVFAAPTIIYFENGKELMRLSRFFSISRCDQSLRLNMHNR